MNLFFQVIPATTYIEMSLSQKDASPGICFTQHILKNDFCCWHFGCSSIKNTVYLGVISNSLKQFVKMPMRLCC